MARTLDAVQLQYNNYYLPSKYSNILIPNLFYNSFLQPGVTYTDKYRMGNAGQIFVMRLKQDEAKLSQSCTETFDHKEIGNEILQITLNNSIDSSKKVWDLQATVAEYSVISETLRLQAREIAETWNKAAIAALFTEGTGVTTQTNWPKNKDELKKDILSAKTQLYKDKRKASVMLCTPDFYQMVLEFAGQEFTPTINDRMVYSGEVGTWLGLRFINLNLLQNIGEFKYFDYTWTEKTVPGTDIEKIGYILYDPEAFSVLVNFNKIRMIGAPEFMGQFLQSEINTGFRVTDKNSVFIRKYNAKRN